MYFFSIKLFRSHNMLQHLDSPSNIQIVLPTFRQSLTGHILMIFNIVRIYVLQNRQIAIVQTLINSLNLEGSSEKQMNPITQDYLSHKSTEVPSVYQNERPVLVISAYGKIQIFQISPNKVYYQSFGIFLAFLPKILPTQFFYQ